MRIGSFPPGQQQPHQHGPFLRLDGAGPLSAAVFRVQAAARDGRIFDSMSSHSRFGTSSAAQPVVFNFTFKIGPLTRIDILLTSIAEILAFRLLGCLMDTTLSPRAVLLTMLFIVVSLVCQAVIHCVHMLHA